MPTLTSFIDIFRRSNLNHHGSTSDPSTVLRACSSTRVPLAGLMPAIAITIGLGIPAIGSAIVLPEGFVDEAFISAIPGQVTGFEFADTGRVFLSEKAGIIRVAVNGTVLAEPFLDISDIVNDRVDRGMMDLALHPQFPATPYVYVLYAFDPPELVTNGFTGPGRQDGSGNRVARLVRYTADATKNFNVALPGSERILMGSNSTFDNIGEPEGRFDTRIPSCGPIGNPTQDCLPADELSHTVGAVAFAPDGSLYVTNGDGASYQSVEELSFMSLDIDSMRGKIFRIDAQTGGGLASNPHFDGNPQSNRSKVIAHGLRNPYSLAIHPETGEPFVGDVGFEYFEEINGGFNQNFGWPCYLGATATSIRQRSPFFEDLALCQSYYQSSDVIAEPLVSWPWNGGAAAMAGDFYTGSQFPANYQGKLFYADFVQGWMRYVDISDRANVQSTDFATEVPPLTQITTGADGALYYASIVTNDIRRIRFVGETGGETSGETGGNTGGNTDGNTGGNTDGNSDGSTGSTTTGGGGATDTPLVSTGGGTLGYGWLVIAATLIGWRRIVGRMGRMGRMGRV